MNADSVAHYPIKFNPHKTTRRLLLAAIRYPRHWAWMQASFPQVDAADLRDAVTHVEQALSVSAKAVILMSQYELQALAHAIYAGPVKDRGLVAFGARMMEFTGDRNYDVFYGAPNGEWG